MSEILVLAAHDGESVKKVTLELLTLARRFGEPAAVWLGSGADAGRERLAGYGAAKGYTAGGDGMTDYAGARAGRGARRAGGAGVPGGGAGPRHGRGQGGRGAARRQDRLRSAHRRGGPHPR